MAKTNPFGPKGWTPERLGSLTGKTYLITGANSGAGFEASRVFLSKGAKVVMLNRNADKSTAAIASLKEEFGSDADVTFVRMDLGALNSVREASEEILEKVPHIDALICNAAIAQVAKQQITVDGFESQLGVNHFGHFLLCGLLFDRVEASAGRIVVVGSNAYKMGLKKIQFEDLNFDANYTAWNSYAQSKLAQMMFAYELQRRVEAAGKNVTVQVCHPGASRTNLLQETASTLNKIAWAILSRFIAQSAERGSWPEVMCAAEPEVDSVKLYGPTKRGQMVGPVGECPLDDCALDREAAAKLWTLSEQKTSLAWSP
ncbi:oxidoreductase, short chain dehydrogenase/reductase family [Rhodopirellula maiorica SM1]|uniref:Oxidoreductase, short chain dehydrogenase/reductase family n=1 Tax=Rhodopirellula maiorica SM1 TaxID=1265738 RepID=M5RS32_9BACT|nr:SDR family oxidoreductase [Rhodopirellula maiorica]EMI22153.1 oxidoreductase, short chain dehydrogenase/reductase family [Rhodopirellula maiorica SM1]